MISYNLKNKRSVNNEIPGDIFTNYIKASRK